MCEFCIKHGEGKKWYLNIKNYSLDLLSDLKRRKFVREFMSSTVEEGERGISRLEGSVARGRKISRFLKWFLVRRMKPVHYGQVVPLEDVERIFELSSTIVRVPCVCRWAAKRKEARFCFPISIGPPHWFEEMDMADFGSPDVSRFENMSFDEAVGNLRDFDRKGMVHTVWTFRTPFIGAVCNCDRADCLAMRSTIGVELPMMFRAEYIALIDAERCSGCRECSRLCQFGAVCFSLLEGRCSVDRAKCYGCGVCRAVCKQDAIRLVGRAVVSGTRA